MLRKLLMVTVFAAFILGASLIVWAVSPGDPLPGLTAEQLAAFEEGRDDFAEVEAPPDGLGPVFNEKGCGVCHDLPAIGGTGDELEVRAGRLVNGVFDPLTNLGGSLFQLFGLNGQVPGCTTNGEVVPSQANVVARRRVQTLFGLGFVDFTPEATFRAIANSQPVSVRGKVPMVFNISAGRNTMGKFGWKSQNPTLFQFAGDAYVNEMGITSPQFPNENPPQGDASALVACDKVPDPEDDGTAITNFNNFMQLLAPVAPRTFGPSENAGSLVFNRLGCDKCHVRNITSGSSPIAALSNKVYHPFSDFLLHDMGSLGDNIVQAGAGLREMRTAPLWGLRLANHSLLLHDGRANSIEQAILLHAGQGAAAANAFRAASNTDKQNLVNFLRAL